MTEALATALLVAAMFLVFHCFRRDAVSPRQTHRSGSRTCRRRVRGHPGGHTDCCCAFHAAASYVEGRAAAMVLLPTVVAVMGWSAFNYAAVGAFSLTSASGVVLYTHVKDFVETPRNTRQSTKSTRTCDA